MKKNHSTWSTVVRDYEVDFQGIVNNACYFNYLAQARAHHLEDIGIDVVKMAKEGINIILIDTHVKFKKALKYKDDFIINSELKRISKFKFLFIQDIICKNSSKLCVNAHSIIGCILSETNKPCILPALENIEISSNLSIE